MPLEEVTEWSGAKSELLLLLLRLVRINMQVAITGFRIWRSKAKPDHCVRLRFTKWVGLRISLERGQKDSDQSDGCQYDSCLFSEWGRKSASLS